jgi:hypothetical protein
LYLDREPWRELLAIASKSGPVSMVSVYVVGVTFLRAAPIVVTPTVFPVV